MSVVVVQKRSDLGWYLQSGSGDVGSSFEKHVSGLAWCLDEL